MFINHTNHPSQYWSDEQLAAAHQYGEVVDIPFPLIDPALPSGEIGQLVQEYTGRIISLNPQAVLCQGEVVYCHALAATSERLVSESYEAGINEKIVNFQFVQFREYCHL